MRFRVLLRPHPGPGVLLLRTVVPPSFKAALPPSFTEAPSRPAAEKAHTHNSTLRALNPFVWAPSLTRSPHSRPQTDLASEPQA